MERWLIRGAMGFAGLALGVAPSAAFGAESPPVELSPAGDLSGTAGSASVTVLNNTASDVTVTVTGWIEVDDGRGDLEVTQKVDGGSAQPWTIPAAGTLDLAITAPIDHQDGSGIVTVVVAQGSETVVIRRAIAFAGTDPAALVTKRSTDVDRWVPIFGPDSWMHVVPVKSCPAELATKEVTFTSERDDVTAEVSCANSKLAITSAELPDVGTYTATYGSGDGKVELTLVSHRWIGWAVLLALLGLGAALVQKGYLDNIRPVQRLRNRVQRLTPAAAEADDEFTKELANETEAGKVAHATYRISSGVEAIAERFLVQIGTQLVVSGWKRFVPRPAEDDAKRLAALGDEVTKLADAITAWRRSTDLLKKLRDAINGPGGQSPLVVHGQALLGAAGTTIHLGSDQIEPTRRDVEATTKFIELHPVIDRMQSALKAREENPPASGSAEAMWLQEASGLLRQVTSKIEQATTGTELVDAKVDHTLDEVKLLVSRLSPARPPADERGGPLGQAGRRRRVEAEAPIGDVALDVLRRKWQIAASESRFRVQRADLWLVLVACLAGVWAGLVAWYFDKPWGTATDAITAVLWGYGTAVVTEPLMSAAQRWAQGEPRLSETA